MRELHIRVNLGMETWVEVVKEVLLEKLKIPRIKHISGKESYENCEILIVEYSDDIYVIGLWKGTRALYAKVSVGSLLRGSWSCNNLEYTPIGYYVFASDPKVLGEKISYKIQLLDKAKDKLKLPLA